MASRFYFRASEVPSVSPAFHSSWTNTASAVRRVMHPTPLAGDSIVTGGSVGSVITELALHRQYVSPPLLAGALFDDTVTTLLAWIACLESAANDNILPRCCVRVVSQDGGTIRKELLQVTGGNEWNTVRNFRRFVNGTMNAGSDYTTVTGDRLVIEVGHTDATGSSIAGQMFFGSDSGVTDYAGITEDGATNTDRPWFEVSTSLVTTEAPDPGWTPRVRVPKPVHVQATIDGRPVRLTDWQCDATVDYGYRTMTGKIPRDVHWAEQEAPISIWLDDGTELWAGKLTLDPQEERGKLGIRAEGYGSLLAARTEPRFFRVDGFEGFVPKDADPHNFPASEHFDSKQNPQALIWRYGAGLTYATGNSDGFCLQIEGAEFTRWEADGEVFGGTLGAFDVRVATAIGPDGAQTVISDTQANTTGYDDDLTTEHDTLILSLRCNTNPGAGIPTAPRRFKLAGGKFYGLTTDDDFSASDVVINVGRLSGFDTSGVQSNGLAVLPLLWTKTHPELLSYMAELTDWQWQALGLIDGAPALTFGPFEGVFNGSQVHNVAPTWENRRRFNAVRVPFVFLSGRKGSRVVTCDDLGLDDPFPGQTVTHLADELEDPQRDGTLAAAMAANLLPYYAAKQAAGRVKVGRLTTVDGIPCSGYKLKPGNLLNVNERADLGPQPVISVSYGEREDVTAEINDEFNVVRLLAQLQADLRRNHRRRRRR